MKSLLYITFLWAIGKLITENLHLPIPGSVLGMLLLTLLLQLNIIKREDVKATAQFLTKHLNLFFIPAGVGLMSYFGLLSEHLLPIVTLSIISTLAVLWTVGGSFQAFNRHKS